MIRACVGIPAFDRFTELTFLSELTRVEDFHMIYRDFNGIYRRHVHDAKFDVVNESEFKSLKERLLAVRHLLEKYPELSPGRRTELIQTALSEDSLQRALQISPEPSLLSRPSGFSSGLKDTKKKAKKITSGVSDSDFLLQLNGIHDKDLGAPIRRVVDLACTQLSYSIDAAVRKMTHDMLQMQQKECKGSIEYEIRAEERKALRGTLMKFIRDVNTISAARGTSL